MKKLLIISPYFPPSNAADMQRVRLSLPYLKRFGWRAEVVTVDPAFSDMPKDELLLVNIPMDINIHYVRAFSKKWTSRFGLGSLALRSLWFYHRCVIQLLKKETFDLIYFSTTQFPVCILGSYWKMRFGVPYVIDMQDPWHSDYYQDKPKTERPPKYWFSYRLNKFLEPLAMRRLGGLISVSAQYITDLRERYPELVSIPAATITFGADAGDLGVASDNSVQFPPLLDDRMVNLVYVGRGGADMSNALTALFKALAGERDLHPDLFKKLRMHFIGTSYAPAGLGRPTILPLAEKFGLGDIVTEMTDRISYFHSLVTLQKADALLMPGSDDPKYTASKIYPYLLTRKPLLAIFNSNSPAMGVFKAYRAPYVYSYDQTDGLSTRIVEFVVKVITGEMSEQVYDERGIREYSAAHMTERQCGLFDRVLEKL